MALFGIHFNFFNYLIWLRITDEGLLPEMRIWSILLIKSDLKWCIPSKKKSLCLIMNKALLRSVNGYLNCVVILMINGLPY